MAIRVRDSEELRRLLETLAAEIVDANIFWRLHKNVQIAGATFGREAAQMPAFWSLTQQALMDAAVFRMCKVYDQYPGALNLRNLLETIQTNLPLFAEADFRDRLKGNAFVDSLAADCRIPDSTQLKTDLDYVSPDTNPLVKQLVEARNQLYAHRSARDAIRQVDLAVQYPMTKGQADELLTRAAEIVNCYSQLFAAVVYSTGMIGEDDYKHVFEAIRWDLERRDTEIHREGIRRDLYEAWQAAERRSTEGG